MFEIAIVLAGYVAIGATVAAVRGVRPAQVARAVRHAAYAAVVVAGIAFFPVALAVTVAVRSAREAIAG